MSIESSFSWRLLHRFFVEKNGLQFASWFNDMLPSNCKELTLNTALGAIRKKMRQMNIIKKNEMLHLFLGVDEYQSIGKINGIQLGDQSLLRDFIDMIGAVIASPVLNIKIYPLLAGTDFASVSIINSSKVETIRLSMNLLTPVEVQRVIETEKYGEHLLSLSCVRRHLFFLGGVPRWCMIFINELQSKIADRHDPTPTITEAQDAFNFTRSLYIDGWAGMLEQGDFLKLIGNYYSIKVIYSFCYIWCIDRRKCEGCW